MGAIDMFNDFVKLIESESLPVEAVAIADGDAIIAERHFVPDQDRNIYSHTKSYVSTAIGIAIEDGLLSLDSSSVSLRSCATARSSGVLSASVDGWLKNGMDVMISRCM